MPQIALMFAGLLTGLGDVDWKSTLLVLGGVCGVSGLFCVICCATFNAHPSRERREDTDGAADTATHESNCLENVSDERSTPEVTNSERKSAMKCEYCENEIMNHVGETCPFCGAPIGASGALPQVNLDVRETRIGKVVRCHKCQCDNELCDIMQTRKCKWCDEDLLPITDGLMSDSNDESSSTKLEDTPQVSKIKSLISALRNENIFSGIDVSDYGFVPTSGEIVYEVVDDITLNESRSVRRSHTEKTGSSVYDYEGRSESKTHYEFQSVTDGNLFLTRRRIVFTGGQQVRNIKFDDIVSFESDWRRDEGAVQISSSKRTKAMRFTGADVFKFTLIYNAIRSEKFRTLFEKGPDDELVSKFVEIGLFYTPPPAPVYAPEPSDDYSAPVQEDSSGQNGYGCVVLVIFLLVLLVVIFAIANSK